MMMVMISFPVIFSVTDINVSGFSPVELTWIIYHFNL